MSDPIKDAVGALLTTPTTSPVTPLATLAAVEGASAVNVPLEVPVDGGIEWRTMHAESEDSASEASEGVLKVCI